MRMYSASGRSRWPIVLGAAIVIVAVGGGIVYATNRGDSQPTATITSSAPAAAPTSSSTGGTSGGGDNEDDVAPTGCLGGQDRNAAMVLAAQKAAKHTTYGAVEVATAFARWLYQYPYPSLDEANSVSRGIMSASAPASFKDLAGGFAKAGDNPAGNVVPAGTPFHLSTTNGLWRVTGDSSSDSVEVTLSAGYVIGGALSPTKVAATGYVMVWESGAWRVSTGLTPDQTQLGNGGTGFTGGC